MVSYVPFIWFEIYILGSFACFCSMHPHNRVKACSFKISNRGQEIYCASNDVNRLPESAKLKTNVLGVPPLHPYVQHRDSTGRTFCSAGVCTHPGRAIESRDYTAEEKIGVLLLNLGGPETLNDVQPFLYNLFADPVS